MEEALTKHLAGATCDEVAKVLKRSSLEILVSSKVAVASLNRLFVLLIIGLPWKLMYPLLANVKHVSFITKGSTL